MKNFILLLTFLLLCSLAPDNLEPFKLTWYLVIGAIVGLYEVIARLIPSVGQNGLVGKIIDFLKWLSDKLNSSKTSKSKKL